MATGDLPGDYGLDRAVAGKRRGRGESSIYFEHEPGYSCRDIRYHRSCAGRWRGEITTVPRAGAGRVRQRVKTPGAGLRSAAAPRFGPGHPPGVATGGPARWRG